MPIRFRCPGCEGLLSIATRKAGAEIGCPKCGEALIVPPPPDSDPTPKPKRPKGKSLEEKTELDMTPPGAGPALLTEAKPRARSKPAAGDPPLFERSDFERLLEPAVKKAADTTEAKPEAPKPAPASSPEPAEKPGARAEALKLGLPVADDGVYVSRRTAVLVGVAFLALLGLAFAAGFGAASLFS